jgi:hypothetical protein
MVQRPPVSILPVTLPFTALTIFAFASLITVLLGRVVVIPTEPTAKKQT